MPDKIVPEPTPRALTLEQKRRIIAKYVERHRKLPYPDPVAAPPFSHGPGPTAADRTALVASRVWDNRWNIVRHFIVDGGGAAIAAFTATKDLTVTGAAFLVGGVVGAARKGIDDERRAAGKPDMLTSVLRPKTKGATMGIRDEVGQFQNELRDLVMIFFDETPDRGQVMEIASSAWDAFTEAKDLKGLSKDDMVKAGIDTALTVAASLKDKFIQYSDEVAPE